MRCEIPAPRRCCFCVPLRIGLLVVGYIKLILSALYLLYTIANFCVTLSNIEFSEHYVIILIIFFSILNSTVDVFFHLLFLIGAHRKDYKKIRIYYRYSIYNIIAITVLFFVNMGIFLNIFILFFALKYVIFLVVLYLWTIVVQVYLMLLVRSEFLKLKATTQFQFVNNEAEAQCSATIHISDDVDEVDNDKENDYDKISV